MGSVEWENGYQRDSPRGHFWRRMREAMSGVAGCKDFAVVEKMMMRRKKKKNKKKKTKQAPQRQRRLSKFQYDPWSYALNFDEGSDGNFLGMLGSHGGGGGGGVRVTWFWFMFSGLGPSDVIREGGGVCHFSFF
ncbi:hypothetical protein MLD38_010029 [Melastoma candidum]|uniref:Uncharacterized protein n=1 Tax=Melastoma candidum TaxID=119954 RepID=A0ACB9QZL9_9MYRT|nr:hypothetical protein MLD38_010029 [Melastoma candidum]